MDEGIPSEITGELRKTIHAELLRVHSRHLALRQYRGKLHDSLWEAYDVYADSLGRAGWRLTDTLLNESIPLWVFRWAVVKQWVKYPLLRPFQAIPDAELTAQFGEYKVTDSYKAWFMKRLASSIACWQAEALERGVARAGRSSSKEAGRPVAELVAAARAQNLIRPSYGRRFGTPSVRQRHGSASS
jgi:hypothetical protein